jgi:hypothetical protein
LISGAGTGADGMLAGRGAGGCSSFLFHMLTWAASKYV